MIVAVDIGNTNIVIGAFEKEDLLFMERISTIHSDTGFEYLMKIKNILDLHKINYKSISGSIISSVVPICAQKIESALIRLTDKKPLTVSYKMKTDLDICIDDPSTLGSDQIVDAVAVVNQYKLPALIVDMGTATTISVIDENKRYLGGAILPGMGISLDALTSRTSKLPKIGIEKPCAPIGKNTVECMKSGIVYGSCAQIDGLCERFAEALGVSMENITIVATGGLSSTIVNFCKNKVILDEELLLKGLYILYKKNR